MSFWTILMILGAVAAFLYGIWAGLGTWDQSQEEIDRAMSEPGRRRKATRHFTPLDLMARVTGIPTQRDRRNPFRFGEDDEGLADPRAGSRPRPGPGGNPGTPSPADEGVDDDEGASDDRSEEISEPDDHS
ncbi:MAG: hypothetical protein ACOC8K_06230 [Gemmatimonadota bacterium]